MNNINKQNLNTVLTVFGIIIVILMFMIVLFAANYKDQSKTTSVVFDKPIQKNNNTININNYRNMVCKGKDLSEILYSKIIQNNDVNKTIIVGIRANCVETQYYKRWNETHRDWDYFKTEDFTVDEKVFWDDRGTIYDFSDNKNYRSLVGM